jgi:hypothetical protein
MRRRSNNVLAGALAAALVALVAACSSGAQSTLPAGQQALGASGGATKGSAVSPTKYSASAPAPLAPDRFAAAQGQSLTDAQIDSYIDSSVTGADRTLAHKLMAFMPPNLRGDFVYMGSGGHLISNNPALLQNTKFTQGTYSTVTTIQARGVAHPMDYASSCSPADPPNPSGGAYIRQVSQCGFNGGWAFVNIPCYSASLASGENGLAYFEVTGVNQSSEVEGGVFTPDGSTFDPYLRSSSYATNGGYESLINATNREACGENIFIVHGIEQSGAFTYTMIGDGSSYNPESVWVNESDVTPANPSWLFGPGPSGITGPGTDALGNPSPCMQCSISQVTALSQTDSSGNPVVTPNLDGSYFGVNANGTGSNDVNWLQVAFGNWGSDCVAGTTLCTLYTSNDPLLYYGGAQNYPNSLYAQTNYGLTGYGPYETYDGIALPVGSSSDISQRPAAGGFVTPPPPPTPTPVPTATPVPTTRPVPTHTPGGPNCVKDPSLCA